MEVAGVREVAVDDPRLGGVAMGGMLFGLKVRTRGRAGSQTAIKERWAVEANKLTAQSEAQVVVHRPKLDTLFETKKVQIVRVESSGEDLKTTIETSAELETTLETSRN